MILCSPLCGRLASSGQLPTPPPRQEYQPEILVALILKSVHGAEVLQLRAKNGGLVGVDQRLPLWPAYEVDFVDFDFIDRIVGVSPYRPQARTTFAEPIQTMRWHCPLWFRGPLSVLNGAFMPFEATARASAQSSAAYRSNPILPLSLCQKGLSKRNRTA